MINKETRKNKQREYKNHTYLILPIVVFVIGIVILTMLGIRIRDNQYSLQQSKAKLNATTYAEHMRLDVMRGINATNTLEQIVISMDGDVSKFPEVAENLMTDYIQSLQLAPDGVVSDIYPAEGNEAGKIDLIHDKDRGEICRYGRDNNIITMQGPFALKQGSYGIAVRNPVFIKKNGKREFWGFTIAIIKVPEIFSNSIKALSDFGYDYQLSKRKAPWDDTFIEVYGSGVKMENAATYEFRIGDIDWELDVQPKGGWSSDGSIKMIIGCGFLILLLISCLLTFITLFNRAKASEIRAGELNSELQDALDMANASNAAKTRFISNMSHDIRTPMNAVIGYTGIAMKNTKEEKTREYLEKISESSNHLLTLINDVLDISRIESGKMAFEPVAVDIRAIVDQVLSIAQGFTAGRNLNIEIKRSGEGLPCVYADEVHIREVLVNVLSNAIKYTKDGGTITFAADYEKEPDGKHIKVKYTVADTGIGMSEEFQKHIFEEFTQENSNARTQYIGTGLGMAIVKGYVDMMNGNISIESKKDVGTVVTIELPLEIVADEVEIENQATKNSENKAFGATFGDETSDMAKPGCEISDAEKAENHGKCSGLKCLMAEDNDLNAEIAQFLLEEQGIEIVRALNGKEAVELFSQSEEGEFDLILMDIMMPVMDGIAATENIRRMDRADAKKVPIIAMTANAFAEDAHKCFNAGMNAHLTKPLDTENFIAVISQHCL